ncbi:FecR domain-containing protein, partial [Klebsiella pneumoniae]|nr:FecR domain-containing protein [Klebsiella pneumoniae]
VLGWRTYTTARGELRSVELADGSVVHINTQSRIDVNLSPRAREVRLVGGEALFKVQRDTTRPFLVYSGNAVIQAIGTQFNVRLQQTDTTVSV